MEPETFAILELVFAKISFQVFYEPLNSVTSTPTFYTKNGGRGRI